MHGSGQLTLRNRQFLRPIEPICADMPLPRFTDPAHPMPYAHTAVPVTVSTRPDTNMATNSDTPVEQPTPDAGMSTPCQYYPPDGPIDIAPPMTSAPCAAPTGPSASPVAPTEPRRSLRTTKGIHPKHLQDYV